MKKATKLVKVLNYVSESFDGNPSFILLMNDGKEYISNGSIFTENTEDNITHLRAVDGLKEGLEDLFKSPCKGLEEVTDTSYMFHGCDSLVEFSLEMPNVYKSIYMFKDCTSLIMFNSKMNKTIKTTCMFKGCTSLVAFSSEMSNVSITSFMFKGCTSLVAFSSEMSNITLNNPMFKGCTSLKVKI